MPGQPRERDVGPIVIGEASDEWIVRELERRRCEGALWEAVRVDFWTYAHGAVITIVIRGWLYERSHGLNRPIPLSPDEHQELTRDRAALEELVDEAIVDALDLFAERTCAGLGWTPQGGRGLRDYFVNGVVLQLANPVRRWRRARKARLAIEDDTVDVETVEQCREECLGPEERIVASEDAGAVVRALLQEDPVIARAITLRIDTGWTWKRIAPELGITPKALERRLHRFRASFDADT